MGSIQSTFMHALHMHKPPKHTHLYFRRLSFIYISVLRYLLGVKVLNHAKFLATKIK